MNWKSFADAAKAKKFVLPSGWDSIAKIAEEMGCSEEAARREWDPFVRSAEVERQIFPVWDAMLKRVVRVTAQRPAQAKAPAPQGNDATKKKLSALADKRKRDRHGHFISR
jgi:hypothetical protein